MIVPQCVHHIQCDMFRPVLAAIIQQCYSYNYGNMKLRIHNKCVREYT